jgi:hypothetical protein
VSAARSVAEITLSGPPRNMAVVVPREWSGDRIIPISISVAGRPTIYRAVVRAFGQDRSEIRLRLPGDTPPGRYSGEGTIGGTPRAVVVDVAPVLRIRVQPRQTLLSTAPAASVEFTVTLLNAGNVGFDVPGAEVIDFDDAAGQDRALGRTLRATLAQGERRVDRLFDELKDSHGGEARVRVKNGAGTLAPGESRELECVLEVPSTVLAGRTYTGTWQLGSGVHVLVADVQTSGRPRNGRVRS